MISRLADKILESKRITFFTGAGISEPSGIPDFRSPGGLWEIYSPYEYASITAFKKDPAKVWIFVRDLYNMIWNKSPNKAHKSIFLIQQLLGKENVSIITQNIDSLHQKAGSENILEIHGSPAVMQCIYCNYEEEFDYTLHLSKIPYPICKNCQKPLKPKAIFFEEILDNKIYQKSLQLAKESDVLIAVGTSLEVTPASHIFLSSNAYKSNFNLSSTIFDDDFDIIVRGNCVETLPLLHRKLSEKIDSVKINKDINE